MFFYLIESKGLWCLRERGSFQLISYGLCLGLFGLRTIFPSMEHGLPHQRQWISSVGESTSMFPPQRRHLPLRISNFSYLWGLVTEVLYHSNAKRGICFLITEPHFFCLWVKTGLLTCGATFGGLPRRRHCPVKSP